MAPIRLQALLARAPVAVGFVKEGVFQASSESLQQLLGLDDDAAARGLSTRSLLVSDAAHQALNDKVQACMAAGYPLDEEVECVRGDGSRFWAQIEVNPLDWEQPRGETLWALRDITVARAQRMQPTWAGRHDSVTELSNRREFERRLSEHVASRRNEAVSMLYINLDRFSAVVAQSGIEVTNHFLRSLGQMLMTKVRGSDPVARLEADHFAILLTDCDQHYAEIVAEKIRSSIFNFRMRWGRHRSRIMASIGVLQLHLGIDTVEAALEAAAQASAQARASGGDTVRVHVAQASPQA
jgi:diguanylate cyclase (GGDEF)-like protein/PAS domain S-box-containing protein